MNFIKNAEEQDKLRKSGHLLSDCLDLLVKKAQPGISGEALDIIAEEFIRDNGAVPAFKGYHGGTKVAFPATICFSRNEVAVHGIPTKKEVIKDGDIVTIDCGLVLDGWFADAARLFGAGEVSEEDAFLMEVASNSLEAGIQACRAGNTLGDVGAAIHRVIATGELYGMPELCGHGIGRAMHEDPKVLNFGLPGKGLPLRSGMVLCIEPVVTAKKTKLVTCINDDWSVRTANSCRAAHIEHMVIVGENGPEVLTRSKQ